MGWWMRRADGGIGDVDDGAAGGVEVGDGAAGGQGLAGADLAGDQADGVFVDEPADSGGASCDVGVRSIATRPWST